MQAYLALWDYNETYKQYPPAKQWCDSVLPFLRKEKEAFKNGREHMIAINPNARPDSQNDVVLLFESTGGWNAHGQSELLAPTSNGKPGCYVVFNDGNIEFILPEQTKDLNWGNNP